MFKIFSQKYELFNKTSFGKEKNDACSFYKIKWISNVRF